MSILNMLYKTLLVLVILGCVYGCNASTNDNMIKEGASIQKPAENLRQRPALSGEKRQGTGRDTHPPIKDSVAKEGDGSGRLVGIVTLGPTTPAERVDVPSSAPVSGVKLTILTVAGEEIKSVVSDSNGKYNATLPTGSYRIEMHPSSKVMTKDLPATVTITEDEETRLNIRIDTGIR